MFMLYQRNTIHPCSASQVLEIPDVTWEGYCEREEKGKKAFKRKKPATNNYDLTEKSNPNAGFTEDSQPF